MRESFILQTLSNYCLPRALLVQEYRDVQKQLGRADRYMIRKLPGATAISATLRAIVSNGRGWGEVGGGGGSAEESRLKQDKTGE